MKQKKLNYGVSNSKKVFFIFWLRISNSKYNFFFNFELVTQKQKNNSIIFELLTQSEFLYFSTSSRKIKVNLIFYEVELVIR